MTDRSTLQRLAAALSSPPPHGYDAQTAPPALRPIYNTLSVNPDADYGTLLPFARNRVGSASWVQEGANTRLALPSAVREGLFGTTDLLAGVDTGQVTPRAAETLAFGGMGAGGMAAPRGVLAVGGALASGEARAGGVRALSEPSKVFPWAADRYPATAPPVIAIDKASKKQFLQKELSQEALDFQKQRSLIQKDIEAGNYTPYFDPAKRFDADVSKYPARVETADIRMAKEQTRTKYDAIANDPAAVRRLEEAYDRGMLQSKDSGNWYQMGQLEKEYIKEYGPQAGRVAFKERFADAMSATTGGADPTSNFLMAHYGNYLKRGGQAIPSASYDYPFPIGGRYAGNNMKQFDRMVMQGEGVTPDNPKRYNFSRNFLGDTKGATIDEQMSGLFAPGKKAPPPGTYGHFEGALGTLANQRGVDPRWYQEVGWAGAKDAKSRGGYESKPMISNINESIERTSRLTGLPPQEVVSRMVRGEIPMYGMAVPAPVAVPSSEEIDTRPRAVLSRIMDELAVR